ncbi:MAG: T9SS type A sorting domain-containing protein [Saprospiraceae bacterium]|nr:T9SS type A sorting domain-containing protein [Saprospiraceae bacterium]
MKHALWLLAMVCLGLNAPLRAQKASTPLLRYLDNPALSAKQEHFLSVIRAEKTTHSFRFIQVDLNALQQADRLKLENLGEWGDVYLSRQNITRRGISDMSWFGTIDGYPIATANIVLDGGFVHANFRFDDGLFTIEPLGEGLHVLVRRRYQAYAPENCEDTGKNHRSGEPQKPEKPRNSAGEEEKLSMEGECSIRLLVAFSNQAYASNANPRGEIQLATDNYNTCNSNSNVFHRVEIARMMQVDYDETGDDGTDLDRFRNPGDGIIDNIHDERELYDADMCCLITQELDGCGLADAIGAGYGSAFQVTAYGCAADNLTFAHEFGHLLNARHDTFVDNTAGSNHGLTYLPGGWRTVMAYNDACDCSNETSPCPDSDDRTTPGDPFCTRVQWWSNPNVDYNGNATGSNSRCNNRGAIDAYDNTIAGFEGIAMDKTLSANETIIDEEEANHFGTTSCSNSSGTVFLYDVGSKGSFRGGTSVTLRPGFRAVQGSEFRAYRGTCTNVLPLDDDPAEERSATVEQASSIQVLPNPAVDVFTISYELPLDGKVWLDVVNANGQTVRNILAGETQSAGQYRFDENAASLAPGAYYLRWKHASGSEMKKILVVGIR